ncbi:MAG: hypothetical protein ACTHJL_11730 [Amnibacterium sp.]
MSRSTITGLVIWSVGSLVAGAVLFIVAAALVVSANGRLPNDVGLVDLGGAPAAFVVSAVLLAVLLLLASVVLALVAWIGALIETAALPEKGWFVAILVVGVLGMILVADLVYVIGSPGRRQSVPAVEESRLPPPVLSDR